MLRTIFTKIFTRNMLLILSVGIFLFGLLKYVDYRLKLAEEEFRARDAKMAQIEKEFKKSTEDLQNLLFSTASGLERVIEQEQERSNSLNKEFQDITNTVDTLQKLSTTDPELLKKYSKVYFLNEHYVPISLSNIPPEYRNKKSTNFQIHSNVLKYLENLIDDANSNGALSLQAQSAYRSFAAQSILKSNYKITYGAGTANSFSADQGYSEHQLGTTLDFTTRKIDGALDGFDKTPEYKWLLDNAYKYGFIISYPSGNTYYKFEPWHWRFVGVELAKRLHNDGVNFYDLDQRIIDTYLANIFD